MLNRIDMTEQNGSWIGTFSGADAQRYLYRSAERAELERLCRANRGNNRAFVLEGAIVRAAQSTEGYALQYMRPGRVLVVFPPVMTLETAEDVLRFAAQKANATEDAPLVLGNVSLWIDGGILIHWPATEQWDRQAFKASLEAHLERYSEELKALVAGRV